VSPPGSNASTSILCVQNTVLALHNRFNQLWGAVNGDKVFVEMHRHEVALDGRPVLVNPAFK
jgi:hypothetical protein